ncbi:NAD(P)-binding protein [Cryphonectria parasitica EP155]|uniref:NAD(P)-binding protein n=1 Tax=Cryphonectria parasitica (strain ATCC 38755 / EP155) TaxID=660469 RepID=A0A9P5CUH8_CRYP1|nr:NAD(P)-binding protein [Cryphonectria parasitica EP155]KAF3771333.1 NAD(P)-binding protein [Cryphonectria parasitica EP155]
MATVTPQSPPPPSAPFNVAGKTAIVTGAGSGINLSFAALLLNRKCNVVLADLALRPEAEDLVKAHSDPNKTTTSRAVFVKTDVTSWPALAHMFDVAHREFGGVDIVCPGAGVYEPHWSSFWHPPGSAASTDAVDAGHYALLDINLTHPIRATQLAMSRWLHPANQSTMTTTTTTTPKRIVHIGSVAGQMANLNAPLYGASKFGITGFVRSLAPLEARHGIRVNAVAPGVVRTPLWEENPEKMAFIDPAQDGWVTPDEVAVAMLRCVEEEGLVGGTILEVGKARTRCVEMLNDPGPSMDPRDGLVVRNAHEGNAMVWTWLEDRTIWGQPPSQSES